MKKKKTQGTTREGAPCAVLALAADMRIRKRLKTKNEETESIASPLLHEVLDNKRGPQVDHAELCSWLKKNKRSKPSKGHVDDIKCDHTAEISLNNLLPEANSSACEKDDLKAGPNSETEPAGQKIYKRRRKRKTNVESNKDAAQSKMLGDVAGVALSGYTSEATQDCRGHNSVESTNNSPDVEAGSGRAISSSTHTYSPAQSYGYSVSALDSKVDIGSIEKYNKDEGVANDSSEMKILICNSKRGVKTYARRTNKDCDFPKVDSKSIQECSSSLVVTGEGIMGNTFSNQSGETPSGGCSKDVNGKKMFEGQDSPLPVVEDVLVDKVIDCCTDLECAKGQNGGKTGVNNSLVKASEGCLENSKPSVDSFKVNIGKSKLENLSEELSKAGELGMSLEGKAFGDESGKTTPDGTLYSHSVVLLSDSRNSKNDATQVSTNINLSVGRPLSSSSRKKLLVLDINGLLADIIRYVPETHTPDTVISMRAVFKRPFYEDFLQFCFERFSVGVWSSRVKRNVESVVDFLLGDSKQKLLFCWDQSHCTETGFYTVENREKPLLVKKLQKLWEKCEPDLPWERGEYSEANTLMLDDSPYKALLNPPHTAIFPDSYRYRNKEFDNSLGPGGALRIYLEGLANAENVQKYVEENPFGQRPITEKNASWRFYQTVIEANQAAPGNAHNSSTDGSDRGRVIQSSREYWDPAYEGRNNCPESREQRASDYSNKRKFSDTNGIDWGSRERQRRGEDWNSAYKALDKHPVTFKQRASDYHYRSTFSDARRPDYGSRIERRGGGDWNHAYQDVDRRPSYYDRRAVSDYRNRYSSHDPRGGDWHPASYDRRAVSDCDRGVRRRGDWIPSYQAPDQYSSSVDERASGYYNRHARVSFHWRAYQKDSLRSQ